MGFSLVKRTSYLLSSNVVVTNGIYKKLDT